MLNSWAKAIEKQEVKAFLIFVGLIATLALGPISVFGVYLLITSIFSDAPDRFMMFGWSIVGTGGFIGLVSAWVRVVVPSKRFRESIVLKLVTSLGLVIGLTGPALMLYGTGGHLSNPMEWLMVPAFGVGVFLLGATIWESKSAL